MTGGTAVAFSLYVVGLGAWALGWERLGRAAAMASLLLVLVGGAYALLRWTGAPPLPPAAAALAGVPFSSTMTAAAFLVIAGLLLCLNRPSRGLGEAGLGAFSIAALLLSAVPLLDQAALIGPISGAHAPGRASLATAAGFGAMGLLGMALAGRRLHAAEALAGPQWPPVAVGAGVALVAGLLSIAPAMLFETAIGLALCTGLFAGILVYQAQLLERGRHRARRASAVLAGRAARRTRDFLHELSQRERMAANLEHAAKHDALTGLPNRARFDELLAAAVDQVHGQESRLAVLVVDLDNFKDINDGLGYSLGNELLIQVARRIRDALRAGDVLARQGSDEFFVLLAPPTDRERSAQVGAAVLSALRGAFELGGHQVHVSASVGAATYSGGGDEAATLVERADAAMHYAKARGRNRLEFHVDTLHVELTERMRMKTALAQAIGQHELTVRYQPRIELESGRLVGAEALVRWHRAGVGFVAPDVFVPLAEQTGLINRLGREVLEIVCRDLNAWGGTGVPLPIVSINASALQFRDERLLEDIRECIAPYPEVARHLEVELTERVLLEDQLSHQRVLHELVDLGLRIALDDFGTGCSSFSYFRHFPVQVVKIDKSFIAGMVEDATDAMITESIIDLARNFRLRVVAEGVETEPQRLRLRERGCHEAQGFLFARPEPAEVFLASWRKALA